MSDTKVIQKYFDVCFYTAVFFCIKTVARGVIKSPFIFVSEFQMYNFTSFAMALNELDKEMESVIPKTDCRLRPDIRAMENGEIGNFSNGQKRFYFFLKLRNWKKSC